MSATAVRVPVTGGHSESVIEFSNDFEINEIKDLLNKQEGVIVVDDFFFILSNASILQKKCL